MNFRWWIFSAMLFVSAPSWSSIYTENYLWDKRELTTCFADDHRDRKNGPLVLKFREWKRSDKEKIKRWVQSEFSAERTGIHFVGFDDCEVNPEADVAIFYNKNNKLESRLFGGLDGIASLGTSLHTQNIGWLFGFKLINSYVSISNSGMNKGTVIHEFGHIAGLMHEHDHPDAERLEPECKYTEEWGTLSGFVYEAYDRNSVMNYCKLDKRGGKKIGLSSTDVDVLKRIYPNDPLPPLENH